MPQHYPLDWNAPLIPAVTAGLLEQAQNSSHDLSHLLVLVPTRQSGRRLHQSLQQAQPDLKLPLIRTPDAFLSETLPEPAPAEDRSVLAAWFACLKDLPLEDFPAVFPKEPPTTTAWLLSMAQSLLQLRRELGEIGLTIEAAAKKAAEAELESERWRQLTRLEQHYLDALEQRRLRDPVIARRAAAENFQTPKGITHIILAASPDPQALPLLALNQASDNLTIEVWHYGPAEAFDTWGRPRPEYWNERPLALEAWGVQFQPCADPQETATTLAESVSDNPESHCLGIVDPSLVPFVERALHKKNLSSYDPEGQALHLGGCGHLAELWCQFSEQASLQNIRSLMQNPLCYHWLAPEVSPDTLLKEIDELFEKHLTPDLKTLLFFCRNPHLGTALEKIKRLREELLKADNFPQALSKHLQACAATAHEAIPVDWESLKLCLETCVEAAGQFPKLSPSFHRLAFKQALHQGKSYLERPEHAHNLLGWLELLWNDAPHLALAGLNEGIVPEATPGNTFLPESLREILGLRTETQRFARDAYLLEALCRRRAHKDGKINCIIPQALADATPLKPSRLLFQAEDAPFLERIQTFFKTKDAATPPAITHNLPWRLRPLPDLSLPDHFSPSSLNNYLKCPFRFFLRHVMEMRPLELDARELTPSSFGNCFHDVVAELKGRTLDHNLKAETFTRELQDATAQYLQKKYGNQRSFALRLQQEALDGRIQAFVNRQLETIALHGSTRIEATEKRFEMTLHHSKIVGYIDRIDQGENGTTLFDYKTADTPKTPTVAHLMRANSANEPAHLPPEAQFEHNGKTLRWINLQLPLYALATREEHPKTTRPHLAYINLAKTQEKSAFDYWDDFTEDHLESARNCSLAVIQKIKAGIFWPPNQNIRKEQDDFAPLFPDGIENTVDPDAFKCYRFKT
ncbi:MAG: ATP-dependent helicase/deoxyribonuclease subunit B [Opitutia bacterium UBA7350]|nr:MAG: ATP-dependent helicase/deoxyribonuclease subunit B [Opitutae bacterium UBA7350]